MRVTDNAGQDAAVMQDTRWSAVLARDPQADGRFFFSVRTTGVYCRPSCPARRPQLENVVFHETAEDAENAGYRPCKRCKPKQDCLAEQHALRVAQTCRRIENAMKEPSLQQLARAAGMSASHLHRLFRAQLGLTPKQYAAAHRNATLQTRLAEARTVTDAIYSAGFNSNGRFYATSNQALGMTPSKLRRGGEQMEILFAVGACTLGSVLVGRSTRGVCAILLGDDPRQLVRDLERRFPRAVLKADDAEYDQFVAKVIGLVEAPGTGLSLPIDIRGTAFQRRVWQALRALPAGSTATYQEIADALSMPKAVRAVAKACAANHIAVAVPCHRVIRTDGSLSGYRWGIERKKLLLQRESRPG